MRCIGHERASARSSHLLCKLTDLMRQFTVLEGLLVESHKLTDSGASIKCQCRPLQLVISVCMMQTAATFFLVSGELNAWITTTL